MKKNLLFATTLAVTLGFSALSQAQDLSGFTRLTTEAELLAPQFNVSAKADFDANGIAVGPTGTIYAIDVDAGTTTGQSILRVIPGSPNTVELMATNAQMVTAIELVNGTTAITQFNPRQIGRLSNGNIVVGGFSTGSANGDTLLILTDTIPATISVLHTSVNGADSAIDGLDAFTVIANTVYCTTNETNGNATTADALISFDATATGPTATGTTIMNKAALEAAFGVVGDSAINDLTNDGTDLYAIISSSAPAPDVVAKISTTGVATVHVTKATVVNALFALDATTADVGYNSIAIDNSGTIYLSNSAALSTTVYDDSLIAVGNISGGTGTVRTITKASLGTILGITGTPFIANDSLRFDATNNRIVFAEGSSTSTAQEGIWALPKVSFAASVTNWETY